MKLERHAVLLCGTVAGLLGPVGSATAFDAGMPADLAAARDPALRAELAAADALQQYLEGLSGVTPAGVASTAVLAQNEPQPAPVDIEPRPAAAGSVGTRPANEPAQEAEPAPMTEGIDIEPKLAPRPAAADTPAPTAPAQAATPTPAPAQAAQPAAPQAVQQQAQAAPTTVGQAPEPPAKPPEVAPIFQQPGVLTPKGHYVLEPSLQYDYSSNSRVNIIGFDVSNFLNIGLFDVSRVNSLAWTLGLTGRYGVTNRFEVEARLPFVARHDDTISRPISNTGSASDVLTSAGGDGIGDFEVTGRYQLNDGGPDKPYYVATLRLKSRTGKDEFQVDTIPSTGGTVILKQLPTGTGFFGVQPGLTILVPSDPAVFFGSITYLYNVRRNINDPALGIDGKVNPGDVFGINFGMGIGLNDRSSFSLGYEHNYIGKPTVNGSADPTATSTQVGSLLLGFSYRLSAKTTMNLSLGVGVTKDAPAVQLRLRFPISF